MPHGTTREDNDANMTTGAVYFCSLILRDVRFNRGFCQFCTLPMNPATGNFFVEKDTNVTFGEVNRFQPTFTSWVINLLVYFVWSRSQLDLYVYKSSVRLQSNDGQDISISANTTTASGWIDVG